MKKTYFAPDTKIVKIGVCNMVCLSGRMNPNQTITDSNDFGSRRNNSFWDDEDDYDE